MKGKLKKMEKKEAEEAEEEEAVVEEEAREVNFKLKLNHFDLKKFLIIFSILDLKFWFYYQGEPLGSIFPKIKN